MAAEEAVEEPSKVQELGDESQSPQLSHELSGVDSTVKS